MMNENLYTNRHVTRVLGAKYQTAFSFCHPITKYCTTRRDFATLSWNNKRCQTYFAGLLCIAVSATNPKCAARDLAKPSRIFILYVREDYFNDIPPSWSMRKDCSQ